MGKGPFGCGRPTCKQQHKRKQETRQSHPHPSNHPVRSIFIPNNWRERMDQTDSLSSHRYRKVTCAIFGESCSGKSALIHSLIHNQFQSKYTPTLFEIYTTQEIVELSPSSSSSSTGSTDVDAVQIEIFDFGGSEEHESMRKLVYGTVDVIVVTFDVSLGDKSLKRAKKNWVRRIRKHNTTSPLILCGCKTDQGIRISPISDRRKKRMGCDELVVCSAKTRNGVPDVSKCIARCGVSQMSQLQSRRESQPRNRKARTNESNHSVSKQDGSNVMDAKSTMSGNYFFSSVYSTFINAIYGAPEPSQQQRLASPSNDSDTSATTQPHIPRLPLDELHHQEHRVRNRWSMTWGGRDAALQTPLNSRITRRSSDLPMPKSARTHNEHFANNHQSGTIHEAVDNRSMSAREEMVRGDGTGESNLVIRSMRRLSLNLSNLFGAIQTPQDTS